MMKLSKLIHAVALPAVMVGAVYSAQLGAHYDGAGTGSVNFSTSCPQELHTALSRSVSLLHAFKYDEAEAGFSALAVRVPDCAMAHWGVAMSLWRPLQTRPTLNAFERGRRALHRARQAQYRDGREQAYIEALEQFYAQGEQDYTSRVQAFQVAMAQLSADYPDDVEAQLFYGLAVLSMAQIEIGDRAVALREAVGALTTRLARDYPQHPGVINYLVQAYDHPQLAVQTPRNQVAGAGPALASAHTQHMSSHLYTHQGMWPAVIETNLNATEAARSYARAEGFDGSWDEELHGMDYLTYAYLQSGQDEKVHKLYDNLLQIDQVQPVSTKSAYSFAAIPARMALEQQDWQRAAALPLHPSREAFPWDQYPQYEAVVVFARTLGAARSGDVRAAQQHMAQLNQLYQSLKRSGDRYWTQEVGVQLLAAQGWLQQALGHEEQALSLLQNAARREAALDDRALAPGPVAPASELLGDLLLAQGRPEEARQAYLSTLENARNRFNSLYGAAHAAEQMGDHETAVQYYRKLLSITEQAGGGREQLKHARDFVGGAAAYSVTQRDNQPMRTANTE